MGREWKEFQGSIGAQCQKHFNQVQVGAKGFGIDQNALWGVSNRHSKGGIDLCCLGPNEPHTVIKMIQTTLFIVKVIGLIEGRV